MRLIIETIWLLIEAGWVGKDRVIDPIEKEARRVVRILLRSTGIGIGLPILGGLYGLYSDKSWLVAAMGICAFLGARAISMGITPFVMAIEGALKLAKKITSKPVTAAEKITSEPVVTVEKYLDWVWGVLVAQSFMFLFFAFVPVRNNPEAVPMLFLGLICAASAAKKFKISGKFFEAILWFWSLIVCTNSVLSWFFPGLVQAERDWVASTAVWTNYKHHILLVLAGLVTWIAWKSYKGEDSHPASGGGGGQASSGGNKGGHSNMLPVLLVVLAVAALGTFWYQQSQGQEVVQRQLAQIYLHSVETDDGMIGVEYTKTIPPGAALEKVVDPGFKLTWEVVHPNETVRVKIGTHPPFNYVRGGPVPAASAMGTTVFRFSNQEAIPVLMTFKKESL